MPRSVVAILAVVSALGASCILDVRGLHRADGDADLDVSPPADTGHDGGRDADVDEDPDRDRVSIDADSAVDGRPDVDVDRDEEPDADDADDDELRSFYGVEWGAPVEVEETVDPGGCETDPVLTSDLRWLFLSRPRPPETGCYSDRRFHVFEWNGGEPVHRGQLELFDLTARAESNAHPVDGAPFGRPGALLFVYTVEAASGGLRLRWSWLEGAPPVPTGEPYQEIAELDVGGGGSSPSLTKRGDRIAFSCNLGDGQDDDLWEATGSPVTGFGTPTRLTALNTSDRETDPALSPDGRVMVFVRTEEGDDLDLWVARRVEVDRPFDAPERLPKGSGEINTEAAEMDAFVSASGDLLFVSARGNSETRRVYVALALFP